MKRPKLTKEVCGGEAYEYYPLGKYVVSCPEVCQGRPTFKYTRVLVSGILNELSRGESVGDLVADYGGRISREAILEALSIAGRVMETKVFEDSKGRPQRKPAKARAS